MNHRVYALLLLFLFATGGGAGCTGAKTAEGGGVDYVTRSILPPYAEMTGRDYVMRLSNLEIGMRVRRGTQEVAGTPTLKGRVAVTNRSQGPLNIQGVAVTYVDRQGKIMKVANAGAVATASFPVRVVGPGETFRGKVETTFPKEAVDELERMHIRLVSFPSRYEKMTVFTEIE